MKLNDMRKIYTDFFEGKGHKLVKSSSVVPDNDPTLLFTNSGMVQFKDVFTGKEKRDYTRATSSQKCVRAGGKHNDLDNVGYTTRHLTFFEMLGNFSFGDYFKEEAITYAWEFLSKTLSLPKDKLYFTVYPTDLEARELWKKIANVDDSRVLDVEDNIWSMGDVGPCGFDTEIFYDKGDHVSGGLPGTPDEDGDRYVEIWNNVFMQFETLPNGEKIELKNKNIDTGMGLERIVSVLQGVDSNFEIDFFKNLINYTQDTIGIKKTNENAASFNIIADHIRTTSFLIADGVIPSNEGRGYVLRRIMRRALRHINMLGIKKPVFYKLFENIKEQMGATYTELFDAEKLIIETVKAEEENFGQTLDQGLKILEDEISKTSGKILSGESAFKLYDTYGFPLDLTEDILKNKNMTVDTNGFEERMNEQKQKSKQASSFKGEAGNKQIFYDVKEKTGATEFVGYTDLTSNSNIKSVIKNGEIVDKATKENSDDEIFIIVDKTPFYATSGGQVADKGYIKYNNKNINVLDVTKALDNIFFHKIDLNIGDSISAGVEIEMLVDCNVRKSTAANHSAAHLLQKALKEVVGEHISQKGSWVGDKSLRFDFANPKALSYEQIAQVENLVNKYITQSLDISNDEMPIEDAKKSGAIALFGEKYGDIVRVVNMGDVSIELCGGTHISNTKDVGLLKILKEESIAAGIRRIEAVTGNVAFEMIDKYSIDKNLSASEMIILLQQKIKDEKLEEQNRLAKEFEEKKLQEVQEQNKQIEKAVSLIKIENINNIDFISAVYSDISSKNLKGIAEKIRKDKEKTLITLISTEGGKPSVLIALSDDLTNSLSAVSMVKEASVILGGKGGGGKDSLAQAGGVDITKTDDVISYIEKIIKEN